MSILAFVGNPNQPCGFQLFEMVRQRGSANIMALRQNTARQGFGARSKLGEDLAAARLREGAGNQRKLRIG